MASASDKTGEGQAARPADFSHVADALKDMPHVPLHPLMAHPTAALAAATAIGFGLATHMTSVFLGSLHGAIDATNRLARRLEEEQGKGAAGAPAADETPASDAVAGNTVPEGASRPRAASAKRAGAGTGTAAGKARAVKAPLAGAPSEAEKPASAKPATAKVAKTSGKADDLKRIEGIGPKLEQVLNGRGIRRFADLAALDAAELEALDQAIGLDGRAIRDDWACQARKLARGGRK
ncbi:MAG: 5' DNA nuclease [Allorhizobium sp.]|jgi:NADH-quinone oxidoreductase subunit E